MFDQVKGCRPLSEAELHRALGCFDGHYAARDRAMFILGVKTGFRISELLSLRLVDVEIGGHIAERVTVARRHMKKKIEGRTVILHPEAQKALAEWIAELRRNTDVEPDTFVFRSRKGANRPISSVQAYRILKDAFRLAGVAGQTGTHSMRKTFADRVYTALDRDLIKTQRALGHRNINSTVSYLGFREEEIDDAILSI